MKSLRFFGRVFVGFALALGGLEGLGAKEPVFQGLGTYSRIVTTESAAARRYFDQGLGFYHGFNHGAAIRAFKEAARIDPKCAMAHWGIALANGPHINFPMVPPPAAEAAWKELQLAKQNAEKASPVEKALIDALSHRYVNPQPEDRKPLDEAYAAAMREVWKQFPDDEDVGALFAEAMMDLRPWNHVDARGPAESRHGRNRRHARCGLETESQPSVREPPLHSRRGSIAAPRTRGRRSGPVAESSAGPRAQCSYAVAHRYPARPLAAGDRDQ
jgi:hypothetical protein